MKSSSPYIVIVDYHLGNLFSVAHACEKLGYQAVISHDYDVVAKADALILPGVGAFGEAMRNLRTYGLVDAIHSHIARDKPFMGVCLGLQLLFEGSDEFGVGEGLGVLKGHIRKFANDSYHVPQIGWNTIHAPTNQPDAWANSPLQSCHEDDYMYFVHSFYAHPTDPTDELAQTVYGETRYCSAVKRNSIFATQFHPEKSGKAGLQIYQNWLQSI